MSVAVVLLSLVSLVPGLAHAGLTAAQQKEVQARVDAARSIVARFDAEALAKGLAPGWRIDTMNALLALPSQSLAALTSDAAVVTQRQLLQKARSSKGKAPTKLLGDFGVDLVYFPITPCRLADTRFWLGPIAGGTARGIDDAASGSQGGDAGCTTAIFAADSGGDAAAYAVSLTVLDMSTTGFIALRPAGATELTSLVNFIPGAQVNNFGIVQNLNNGGSEFEVYASASANVIVDVFGVFREPTATALDCQTTGYNTTTLANNASTASFFYSLACATGYVATGGGCYSGIDTVYLLDAGVSSDGVTHFCRWRNLSGSTQSVTAEVRCCRTPGR
jgi:hypothetical protein